MTDTRSNSQKRTFLPAVLIKNYEIIQDLNLGFNIKLNWNYTNNTVVLFKVYKKVLSKAALDKKFIVNQNVLEKTSAGSSAKALNTVLYNKNFFSQNSDVEVLNSSTKHNKIETNLSDGSFKQISVIRYNKQNSEYSFLDKNIKFGETCLYYITAISNSLKETAPDILKINIQSLGAPPAPKVFDILEKDGGLVLSFGNKKSDNIQSYLIYKKRNIDRKFEFMAEVENYGDLTYFLDTEITAKMVYNYKIYSKDLFGNTSTDAIEKNSVFDYNIPTSIFLKPQLFVERVNDFIKIKIVNQNPEEIVSARIERKDLWRFEQKYSLKTFDEIPWLNSIKFKNNIIEFVDKTTQKNRAYSYRITCFGKNAMPKTYSFTPAIEVGSSYKEEEDFIADYIPPKILLIDTNIINTNQRPAYCKFSFKIKGDWSFVNCRINNSKTPIKIDSLHNSVFLSLKNGENSVVFELYDGFKKKVQEYPIIKINI